MIHRSFILRLLWIGFAHLLAASAVSNVSWAARPLPGGMPAEGDAIYQLRDPFRMPEMALQKLEPKEPLQLIPLDKLELLGVTQGKDRVVAMLKDPNGKTWFVREAMKIGMNGGVIEKISSSKVVVREQSFNALGQEETLRVEIQLPRGRVNPLLE